MDCRESLSLRFVFFLLSKSDLVKIILLIIHGFLRWMDFIDATMVFIFANNLFVFFDYLVPLSARQP